MKLTDTTQYQQSDEYEYHKPRVSFSFSARDKSNGKITEKQITFSYFEELDEWNLFHYLEKETKDTMYVTDRNWRIVHDVHWDKAHSSGAEIDIPECVIERFEEMMGLDSLTLTY